MFTDPFLGRGSVNTILLQQLCMQWDKWGVVYTVSAEKLKRRELRQPDSSALQGRLRRDGATGELIVDKSSARAAVTRGPECLKLKNLHRYKPLPGNGWYKTQQAGKGLAVAEVICEMWKLALPLLSACSSEWCVYS
jgi:hypothetical protein